MDWNWFFSSVAQSVAALVGTLLAFVIARLLNSEAEFERRRHLIQEMIHRAERLRDELSIRNFAWYNARRLERALERVRYEVNVRSNKASAEEFAEQLQFPEFVTRNAVLQAIQATLQDIEREREEAEEQRRREVARESQRRSSGLGSLSAFTGLPDLSRMPSLAETARRQSNADAERDRLHEERESIKRLRVEVRDSIRNVSATLIAVRTNPESAQLVARVLAGATILFFFGVIYPLSFLPLSAQWDISYDPRAFVAILFSVRGLILSLASLAYAGIALVLQRVNAGLVYDATTLAELERWTDEASYSEYLPVWRENETAARAVQQTPASSA